MRRVALLGMFFVALLPRTVRAEPRARIEVTLVDAAAADPTLGARIASWFDAARFDVELARATQLDPATVLAPASGEGVRVWVTLVDVQHARLYFAALEASGERTLYLLRDIALDAGLDELGSERIATVLHLSSLALLEGQLESERESVEASLHVEPPPPAAPPPATPAPAPTPQPTRERFRLALGVGYGLVLRGDEGLGHGPRASLEALRAHFGFGLLFTSSLPRTLRFEDVALRLYSLSLTPLLGGHLVLSPRLSLRAYAGPSLSLVRFQPESAASDVVLTGAARELRVSVLAGLGVRLALGRVDLGLALECAVPLEHTHYDIERAGQRQRIAEPWPVMPGAALTLYF
jgi:hypothetical protein